MFLVFDRAVGRASGDSGECTFRQAFPPSKTKAKTAASAFAALLGKFTQCLF